MAIGTLLSVVSDFCARSGYSIPQAIVSISDPAAIQYKSLLEAVGKEITTRWLMQAQKRTATWTVTAATEDQGSLYERTGDDFESIRKDTIYNLTLRRPVFGPISDEDYQIYRAVVNLGPFQRLRIAADRISILPAPAVGQQISFIWRSKNWIRRQSNGTLTDRFSADQDTILFDDELMILGLKAFFKREKGLSYAEDLRAFEAMAADKTSRDGVKPTLSLSGEGQDSLRPGVLVPSGNWPV